MRLKLDAYRKSTKLGEYQAYLETLIAAAQQYKIPASVLFDEISAIGYDGSVINVRNYVRTMKPVARLDPLARFETAPG